MPLRGKKIEAIKDARFVIPAKAGIQYFQLFPGFRVKPGMTEKAVSQRSNA